MVSRKWDLESCEKGYRLSGLITGDGEFVVVQCGSDGRCWRFLSKFKRLDHGADFEAAASPIIFVGKSGAV